MIGCLSARNAKSPLYPLDASKTKALARLFISRWALAPVLAGADETGRQRVTADLQTDMSRQLINWFCTITYAFGL